MNMNKVDVSMESGTPHDLGAHSSAGKKKAQFKLVDNFVCNVLTVNHACHNDLPTLKQMEKEIQKLMT